MDGFSFNAASLRSGFNNHSPEEGGVIDLGLSLKTQVHHPSSQYEEWTHPKPDMSPYPYAQTKPTQQCQCDEDEAEGVQSKERWAYIKVNMDGVVVGRKVCVLHHANYSTLAIQLESMFGRLCISGLRLVQADSDFSLIYKDNEGNWRSVDDVSWEDFVDCVKQLRVVRKNPNPSLVRP